MSQESKIQIRPLRAEEIECRVATVNEKGVRLLLYKDARVDQRILDDTFGMFGWKRSHQCIDGGIYCTVEIYDKDTGEWVSKQDAGSSKFAEKEKSQASDSFKRACFNWGIGRELYSAPFIWVPKEKVNIQNQGDKYYCNERFRVVSIAYSEEREITGLLIVNSKNQPVYKLGQKEEKSRGKKAPSVSAVQMEALKKELQRTGIGVEAVQERYQIDSLEAMSGEIYQKVMSALSKTKSAA